MPQDTELSVVLALSESGDQKEGLAIVETVQQQITESCQHLQLTMDAVHGLCKLNVYLQELYVDFVIFVERRFLLSETLSDEQIERIVKRIELTGQRLDEIECKTALKVINLL